MSYNIFINIIDQFIDMPDPSEDKLTTQIGHYVTHSDSTILNRLNLIPRFNKALYHGISRYENQHQQAVIAYAASRTPPLNLKPSQTMDPKFFRKQFIARMQTLNNDDSKQYQGTAELRASNPTKATITMNELLDKDGLELYKKALEEEVHSKAYMDALFSNSISHFEGPALTKNIALVIAGPSASGKSFVTKSAFLEAAKILPVEKDNQSGNNALSIDGGIARETSQIRKLAIQVALNKGYTGISDLHKSSGELEKAKTRLYKTAEALHQYPEASLKLSLIIPETFSMWINPMDKVRKLMHNLDRLKNTVTVFARVKGTDKAAFQETVSVMGEKRAFAHIPQDSPVNKSPLDLNKTKLPESKEYGAKGFRFGLHGSYFAEQWYALKSKYKIVFSIKNDLRLYKPLPNSNQWGLAKKGEPGAILCSQRLFEQWNKLNEQEKETTRLDQYTDSTLQTEITCISKPRLQSLEKEAVTPEFVTDPEHFETQSLSIMYQLFQTAVKQKDEKSLNAFNRFRDEVLLTLDHSSLSGIQDNVLSHLSHLEQLLITQTIMLRSDSLESEGLTDNSSRSDTSSPAFEIPESFSSDDSLSSLGTTSSFKEKFHQTLGEITDSKESRKSNDGETSNDLNLHN